MLLNPIIAQVAPNFIPFSIENPKINLSMPYVINYNNSPIEFINNAQLSENHEMIIYRLEILFDKEQSGYLEINNWFIPAGARLFIFNDEISYTGPYINSTERKIISGRFLSNSIILEYNVPVNSDFIGNFVIENIVFDDDIFLPSIPEYDYYMISKSRENPRIMLTGYWPPTNEMVRHFSQNIDLNPDGWLGENWEGSGYDIVSFFPEFDPADCSNCGQGYGDLEVDYQDFSQDFWPIIESVNPIAIITFSRGYNDMSWELENRVVNRTNWYNDFTAPFLPTPNPPDDTVENYHVRYTSLPVNEIITAVFNSHLGLNAYLDNTNAGMYLSEFAGYHGVWYKENFENDINIPCFSGGHIHVGGQIDWETAREAAEVTIRTLIQHLNNFMILSGDCNSDGEINILDIVTLTSAILGGIELSSSQFLSVDLDSNGILNVLDIIALVNLIL